MRHKNVTVELWAKVNSRYRASEQSIFQLEFFYEVVFSRKIEKKNNVTFRKLVKTQQMETAFTRPFPQDFLSLLKPWARFRRDSFEPTPRRQNYARRRLIFQPPDR